MKEDIHQLDCEVKTAYGSHVRYAQYADDFLFAIKQACLSRKNDGSLENGNSWINSTRLSALLNLIPRWEEKRKTFSSPISSHWESNSLESRALVWWPKSFYHICRHDRLNRVGLVSLHVSFDLGYSIYTPWKESKSGSKECFPIGISKGLFSVGPKAPLEPWKLKRPVLPSSPIPDGPCWSHWYWWYWSQPCPSIEWN